MYKDLGTIYLQDSLPENEDDQLMLFAYWHHSFDEWYSTIKLRQKLERELWDEYFSYQIVSGLKHGALREAYSYVSKFDRELGGPYRQEFCDVVERCYLRINKTHITRHESDVLRKLEEKTENEVT